MVQAHFNELAIAASSFQSSVLQILRVTLLEANANVRQIKISAVRLFSSCLGGANGAWGPAGVPE
jgi:hypothetical protein